MATTLTKGEVHVWCASLAGHSLQGSLLEGSLDMLSERERERAARLRSRHDLEQFVGSHVLLRIILGRYLDIAPQELRFSYGAHGKPALAEPVENALRFNMSRSREFMLCAVAADVEVGIDIEHVAPVFEVDHLAERFFSSLESNCIRPLSAREKSRAFLSYWVSKEAYVKATGEGLSRPLNSFDISFSGTPALIGTEEKGIESSLWILKPLDGFCRHMAALVAGANLGHVYRFWWPA
jgi:4'-phosphopantetheinyl transferase